MWIDSFLFSWVVSMLEVVSPLYTYPRLIHVHKESLLIQDKEINPPGPSPPKPHTRLSTANARRNTLEITLRFLLGFLFFLFWYCPFTSLFKLVYMSLNDEGNNMI